VASCYTTTQHTGVLCAPHYHYIHELSTGSATITIATVCMNLQDLRQHFVANEVANVELGNKIMAHIAGPREYGARVEDLRLYDAVARDVIRRWTYPMVPDNSTTGRKAVCIVVYKAI
jgi:hypothetical protein